MNNSGVTRSNQIIAEIKCLTSNEVEHERTKQKLPDELEKMQKEKNEIIAELKAGHQKLNELNAKLVQDLQEAKQRIEELKPDGKNKVSDSNEDARKAKTTKQLRKPKIIAVGDSILKNLHGWMMARSKSVKIYSFPGATTEDMVSYLMPLINKKPDHILLHIGTNNLATDSPQEIAENILGLTQMITDKGIGCSVSEIIRRDDSLSLVGQEVNCILTNMLPAQIKLVCNDSIGTHHINGSGLHLSGRDTGALAHNFIQFLKKLDFKQAYV